MPNQLLSRAASLASVAVGVILLAACGQKGPLTLPAAAPVAAAAAASGASR